MLTWLIVCLTLVPLHQAAAARPPEATLSNSEVRARLYLPDPEAGYYRGTRFDWSGAIASLEWHGHNYFGKWFDRYDPKIHDAITGPVEEFLTNGAGLGYDEAKTGRQLRSHRRRSGQEAGRAEVPAVQHLRDRRRWKMDGHQGPRTGFSSFTNSATPEDTPTSTERSCVSTAIRWCWITN
jgi:hypothetical protein